MKCRDARKLIEGGLTQQRPKALTDHLRRCRACRDFLREIADIDGLVGGALNAAPDADARARIMGRMRAALAAEKPGPPDDPDQ